MRRSRFGTLLSLAVVGLALISLWATEAQAKPKIAVLGVEVSGTIDQSSTIVAHDLTEGMRTRAKAGSGPYQLAPNSDRELIDEKVLKNCDSEGPLCMSDIGRDIGADFVLYGRIEKDGDGYKATLRVLDVRNKTQDKPLPVVIPAGSSSDDVRAIAKRAYADLTGSPAPAPARVSGTLQISANVDTGTVYVDDEERERLAGGTAKLSLPAGRYRVAIEAPGHKRKELSVLIRGDGPTTETFTLAVSKASGKGEDPGGVDVWTPVFGVAAAVTLGLAAYSGYQFYQSHQEAGLIVQKDGTRLLNSDDCGNPAFTDAHLQAACDYHDKHVWSLVGSVGVGLVAVGAGYMAFVHHGKETGASSRVSIAPTVSTTGGGALVRMSW